jgi:peptidyl-prolyl cis-trans isomerase D
MSGTKFADVARRESADSASAVHGGSLGWITKGQFVQEFDQAAFALKTGEVSQPVLTRFGYHLIKVDDRKDDSISVSHILLRIQQGDSSAAISDARADSLAKAADATDNPALFTRVAKAVGLKVSTADVTEGQPLVWDGRDVPSVSAWAFTAKVGETSDLIDSPGAYYLARLDSIHPGGKPTVALLRDQIRRQLSHDKKLDMLIPKARQLSAAVAGGKTLAEAAHDAGLTVQTTGMFTRATPVAGLGQATQAVGAAFGLPVGATSEPVKSEDGVFVLHVDRRVQADKQAWQAQKKAQRDQVTQALRRQRVQEFLASLRQSADVVDNREAIERASRAGA